MASRPNVLFVFPDQQRGDWTGYADTPVRTPTLDALLEDGVAFENAVTPSPVCGPARSCLAQGVEFDRTYVKDHHRQDYPIAASTLYERLRDDAGYHTVGTGKFDLQKYSADRATGVDGKNYYDENGFVDWVNVSEMLNHGVDEPVDPYQQFLVEEGLDDVFEEEYPRSVYDTHPTGLPDYAYQDDWIGRQTERLLREAPDDRPWFCQVNFVKPHNPWDVTSGIYHWRLVSDGRHKLIRGFDPSINYGQDRDDVDVWDETKLHAALSEREPHLFDRRPDNVNRRTKMLILASPGYSGSLNEPRYYSRAAVF